jgi:hypothetical protein
MTFELYTQGDLLAISLWLVLTVAMSSARNLLDNPVGVADCTYKNGFQPARPFCAGAF